MTINSWVDTNVKMHQIIRFNYVQLWRSGKLPENLLKKCDYTLIVEVSVFTEPYY